MEFRTMREAGALLRQRRIDRGLTQTQVAELLDTSQDRISKLERGHLRLEVGFVLRAFEALELTLRADPVAPEPDEDPSLGLYGE